VISSGLRAYNLLRNSNQALETKRKPIEIAQKLPLKSALAKQHVTRSCGIKRRLHQDTLVTLEHMELKDIRKEGYMTVILLMKDPFGSKINYCRKKSQLPDDVLLMWGLMPGLERKKRGGEMKVGEERR
jgi:hypothetical protein